MAQLESHAARASSLDFGSAVNALDKLRSEALSPTELKDFTSNAFGPKWITENHLKYYKSKSEKEEAAVNQLLASFETIAEMSNDQWGSEIRITPKDMNTLVEKGFPTLEQRVQNANTWDSLERAAKADPDYERNYATGLEIQKSYNQNRSELDANSDNQISPRELREFAKRDNLDVGAKQMVKFMRDNFESLSYGEKTISDKLMSRIGHRFDPDWEKTTGRLDGGMASLELGALATLASIGVIYVSVEGLAALLPATEIMPPPVSVPLAIGIGAAIGFTATYDHLVFEGYKQHYPERMNQFRKARREQLPSG